MSTIKHENVNTFIGICITAPNVSLLTLYAHKGCLRDVLQNDNINLHADFLYSFVLDIASVSTDVLFCHLSATPQSGRDR